jgi:hypothetical protein
MTTVEILLGLILLVLILISKDLVRLPKQLTSATEEINNAQSQISATLSGMDETILRLWACPICLGYGTVPEWCDPSIAGKRCEECKGTGRKEKQNVEANR